MILDSCVNEIQFNDIIHEFSRISNWLKSEGVSSVRCFSRSLNRFIFWLNKFVLKIEKKRRSLIVKKEQLAPFWLSEPDSLTRNSGNFRGRNWAFDSLRFLKLKVFRFYTPLVFAGEWSADDFHLPYRYGPKVRNIARDLPCILSSDHIAWKIRHSTEPEKVVVKFSIFCRNVWFATRSGSIISGIKNLMDRSFQAMIR